MTISRRHEAALGGGGGGDFGLAVEGEEFYGGATDFAAGVFLDGLY
jgi:hypothetical protein